MSNVQSGNHFFAFADIVTATTTTLVAAVAGFSIVVESLLLSIEAAQTIKFQSSGGTAISPTFSIVENLVANAAEAKAPIMSTKLGEGLQVVSTTTGATRVMITYRLVAE